MRIKHIALFAITAATATMSLSSLAAPQGAGKEVVEVRSSHQQVRMPPFAYDRVQGEYALEDGRVLAVKGKVEDGKRTLYADLGDGPVELIHVGKKRFVAVGKDLNMRFEGERAAHTVYVREAGNRALAATQR